MCTLSSKKINIKTFIGYKYAAKKGKKYYSPATNVEYKIGPVPILSAKQANRKHIDLNFVKAKDMLTPSGHAYESMFTGKTAVFKNIASAVYMKKTGKLIEGYEPVILKMKISKDLAYGNYGFSRVIAGEYIESIEEM